MPVSTLPESRQTSHKLINREAYEPSVAVIGDEPEALLLTVMHAEAGVPIFLVGSFRDEDWRTARRTGAEEARWLLGIHRRTGKILLESDSSKLPLSQIRTLIIVAHTTNTRQTNSLEMTVRKLAPLLTSGIQVVFAGLCKPHYTSSVLRSTIEKQSGLIVGKDLGLGYIPLLWTGERIEEFREKPKMIAGSDDPSSWRLQQDLLRIFPAIARAPSIELAEAAGLFSVVSQGVTNALRLDLARMSERFGLDYDEILSLCNTTGTVFDKQLARHPERATIATSIALLSSIGRDGARVVRAAHRVNESYQLQVMDMIRRALNRCGHGLRRSRVAILGTEGIVKTPWSIAESSSMVEALQRRGVHVSFYPGESSNDGWSRLVGNHARVENNLLKAVANATCTVVALPKSAATEINPSQLALEMNRPGVICDLSRVLEASNVERAGLFYTSIGRGALST